MTYDLVGWVNNGPPARNATNLGHMDQGIKDSHDRLDSLDKLHVVGNSGTALTLNVISGGGIKYVTLTGNCIITLTGADPSRVCTVEILFAQDGTGGRTATFAGGTIRWSGGAYVATTFAGALDRVALTTYDGGSNWFGDIIGKGYA